MSVCQYVNMSEEPKIVFTSEPSDQNKSCSECQQDVRNLFFAMSICQYVNMSEEPKILFTSEPSDQNKSCSECQQDVRNIFFRYVNMSICQYVNMSECNFSAWVSK